MAKKSEIKIAVIGPESCGKTTLAKALASQLGAAYVPEMARQYFETHPHDSYTMNDIVAIAQLQQNTEDMIGQQYRVIICDTSPLVSRIWAEVRFGYCPNEVLRLDANSDYTYTLLCAPDLPWEPDPLRESPHSREKLFQIYAQYLHLKQSHFSLISGLGDERLKQAKLALLNNGISV